MVIEFMQDFHQIDSSSSDFWSSTQGHDVSNFQHQIIITMPLVCCIQNCYCSMIDIISLCIPVSQMYF